MSRMSTFCDASSLCVSPLLVTLGDTLGSVATSPSEARTVDRLVLLCRNGNRMLKRRVQLNSVLWAHFSLYYHDTNSNEPKKCIGHLECTVLVCRDPNHIRKSNLSSHVQLSCESACGITQKLIQSVMYSCYSGFPFSFCSPLKIFLIVDG